MSRTALAVAVAALLPIAAAAWADSPGEIIATRRQGYEHIGKLAKAMKKAVRDEADVKQFAGPAREIAAWGRRIPSLFPPGTETGHDTEARPEIWTNKADFEAKSAKLPVAAEQLATAAESGDKAAFADAFQEMGATCAACHQSYKYR